MRHQGYAMRGDRFAGVRFDQSYDFALPRLGLSWSPRSDLLVFGAVSHARREPAFRDLFDAEGAGSVPLFANGRPLIRPERVNDYELGGRWSAGQRSASFGLFRMDFRDELVYAGQFNTDLGYPILGNAARSVHQGVEAEASTRLGSRPLLDLSANATLSDNHFVRYREVYGTSPGDTVRSDGKALGFFPAVMANLTARAGWGGATVGAEVQHVGRLYLDNTEARDGSAAPHTVLNLSLGYRARPAPAGAPTVELEVRVFNALDTRYETGGYSYFFGGQRYTDFIPAATRSVLGEVRLGF
jgi:iron complex outermembrane receptor protein